jgi:oligopeptidase B
MKKQILAAGLLLFASPALLAQSAPVPPVAAQKPHVLKDPGGRERIDEFYWLRDDDRKDPEMLAYLAAENAYADVLLAPLKPLQQQLFKEITSRIKQDDASVPVQDRGYFYYTRYQQGGEYPIVARRKGSMDAAEEVLLDQNAMAGGKGYFNIGNYEVSQDNRLLAFAEDIVGRRQYIMQVKDIASDRLLPDRIQNAEPDILWSNDGRTIFYIDKDPVTLLSKRVKAHVLGTPASADRLVYEEKDDSFYMSLMRTTSDDFLCIRLTSTVSSELRCASADNPGAFVPLAQRERDFIYDADHVDGRWVIRTNWNAPNYRLMTAVDAEAAAGRTKWSDLVAHDPAVFIEDFQPFAGFIAIEERAEGNKRLRLRANDGVSSLVASDEPAYAMTLGTNPEPGTDWVRYTYDSLTTPERTYEANVKSGERRLLKETPAPGYDPAKYVTERVWIDARDGTKVPVSLVYRKGLKRDGTAPMLQYAYGSYGSSTDPFWSPTIVSLIDRGLVYAMAHIRGGQEMGRAWYDQGHLLNKKNSFTDFIDVTRGLVQRGYAAKGRVAARGGSAGGLLMGAVLNMAPEDYRVVIAQVPFVDVITTMADATIPLTTNEYDEWGNPADPAYYDYMLSYSPYDHVEAKAYPSIFVGTGLWDSQVQYFEPAKWVARLRAKKTDSNPLVFRTNMEAGHGGRSGRLEKYREASEYYAFMLQQLGVTD